MILFKSGRMAQLYIVLLIFSFSPLFGSGRNIELSSLNNSMKIISRRVNFTRLLPIENIELGGQKVTLKDGDSLEKILMSNGIFADGESIGIVYQLNPDLDAKAIKDGAEIIVPFVKGNKKWKMGLDKGGALALTLDYEKKQEFIKVFKEFESSTTSLTKLQLTKFSSTTEKDVFIKTTKSIFDKMESFNVVIEKRTQPLSSEMLQQMTSEAGHLNVLLNDIIKLDRKVGENDIEMVMLISKDMDIKTRSLVKRNKGLEPFPSRWPEVLVTVKTIDIKTIQAVNNLRVYYVPQALWNYRSSDTKSFDRLTSPADKVLPEADYYVWAGNPDNIAPLTERKTLEVRKANGKERIELDLLVK